MTSVERNTLAEFAAELAALKSRVTELEDREAIRNAIASYGPAVDSNRVHDAANLWTSDGAYEVAGFGSHTGPVAISALLQADYHQQLLQDGCAHILSPLQIQLQGERAVALGYSCVFRHHAGAYTAERIAANRWELCKQAGVWRVSRRLTALLDGGAAGQAALRFD